MSWPSPQDYQEAVQNPALAFDDPDLRGCAVECDRLGFPRPRSGNFAVVYKAESADQRTWAVRCFSREVDGQHERYAAITDELRRLRLPFTVDFTYQPHGIKVLGRRYPLLKMEWVRGEGLISYITRHLRVPERLTALADGLTETVRTLAAHGIAHGDLQHGNILVVDERPVLIDYDGMFVPALAGRAGTEIGHANYQHPGRTLAHFGPGLDHFAVWVIALTLKALAADPELWQKHDGGADDCLLLKKRDLAEPDGSAVLKDIEKSNNFLVRLYAGWFRHVLKLGPLDTPPFGLKPPHGGGPLPRPVAPAKATRTTPDWWEDHGTSPSRSVLPERRDAGTRPWWVDHADTPSGGQAGPVRDDAASTGRTSPRDLAGLDFDPPQPDEIPLLPPLPKKAEAHLEFDFQPTVEHLALVGTMLGAIGLVVLSLTGVMPWMAGVVLSVVLLGGLAFLLRYRYRCACGEAVSTVVDIKQELIRFSVEVSTLRDAYRQGAEFVEESQARAGKQLEKQLADLERVCVSELKTVSDQRGEATAAMKGEVDAIRLWYDVRLQAVKATRKTRGLLEGTDGGQELSQLESARDAELANLELAAAAIEDAFHADIARIETERESRRTDLRRRLEQVRRHPVVSVWRVRVATLEKRQERIQHLLELIESELRSSHQRLSIWQYLGSL